MTIKYIPVNDTILDRDGQNNTDFLTNNMYILYQGDISLHDASMCPLLCTILNFNATFVKLFWDRYVFTLPQ